MGDNNAAIQQADDIRSTPSHQHRSAMAEMTVTNIGTNVPDAAAAGVSMRVRVALALRLRAFALPLRLRALVVAARLRAATYVPAPACITIAAELSFAC